MQQAFINSTYRVRVCERCEMLSNASGLKRSVCPQLRPPQPAVYLFILDVSHNAVETGYLDVVCQTLQDNLDS